MPRQTIESIKSDLLKTPLTAWARAEHAYNTLKQDPHPDNDQIALWLAVVNSLAADGYAPDSATGDPGPATKAYYENQVLGTTLPAANAPGVYTSDTHSLPPDSSH